jgi:hypothetical protein
MLDIVVEMSAPVRLVQSQQLTFSLLLRSRLAGHLSVHAQTATREATNLDSA